MDTVYHSSTNKNLSILEPKRTLSKNKYIGDYVFATKSKVLSVMYMVVRGYPTLMNPDSNVPTIVICGEWKKYIDDDKGGALYELPSNLFFETPQKGLDNYELVSIDPVEPIAKTTYRTSIEAMRSFGIKVYFVDQETFDSLINNPRQKELIDKLPEYLGN